MKEKIEQWDLPKGAKVRMIDGTYIVFKKMDGMYAQWFQDGHIRIGNFNGFKKVGDHYEIVTE